MNMMSMMRGVRALATLRRCSRPLIQSFAASSSSSKSDNGVVAAGAAPDLAAGEDLLLEEEESPAVAVDAKQPLTTPSLLQPGVVIYDGVCHLCHTGVKWVIGADKRRKIKFCCLQSKTAEPYMKVCGLEREDVSRRFLFVEGPGLYYQGSTAALRVLSHLPLPYSALSTLTVVPTPLRDAVYDYVAKRRYDWFGKDEDCLVLKEEELLDRFIDREEIMAKIRSNMW
ncbi:hypothetical protein LguiA_032716 [Lonicera macranthoides]